MSHRHSSGGHRGGRGRCASRREHDHHEHTRDRGERGGRRERSSSGRLFQHGDLRLLALHLIGERPRHGYELIKAIEEGTRGAYSPSPGVVYPTLTLLEELGHVTVGASEGTKKLHHITAEGRTYLAAYRPTIDALLARMAQMPGARPGADAPRIAEALANLQLALKTRLARGALSDAQVEAVAAAIDAASLAVDRA